jgi:thioredoxin-like negative regulator of GroEL
LRSTAEAAQARQAEAHGDLGAARSLFEDALAGNPDDPWLRLDLARVYVRQGAIASARSLMDGLVAERPGHARCALCRCCWPSRRRTGASACGSSA